jgi:MarR family transcriptional regulator, temperature-dependent positive regulator of motility
MGTFHRLAAKIRDLADELISSEDFQSEEMPEVSGSLRNLPLFRLARLIYRARRVREDALKIDRLFGEPAWDLLLALYIADRAGRHVSVTAACASAAVPTSTALRYLRRLEDGGIVERNPDRADARRMYVRLSCKGIATMEEALSEYRLSLLSKG